METQYLLLKIFYRDLILWRLNIIYIYTYIKISHKVEIGVPCSFSAQLHCTDETQKVKTVLSADIYIYDLHNVGSSYRVSDRFIDLSIYLSIYILQQMIGQCWEELLLV